jgi:hypothetical protein
LRRYLRSRAVLVTSITSVLALVLLIGHLSAQQDRNWGKGEARPADEVAPQLYSSPAGDVFRLWHRKTDFRVGGGAAFLSLIGPDGTSKPLLEIAPKERGVVPRTPNLAVGPAGELALTYQWRREVPRIKHIRLARSLDGGKTWTQSETPVDTVGTAFTPHGAWGTGRKLVLLWEDERARARAWTIYSRRSSDGGTTWEPEQIVSRFPEDFAGDTHFSPVLVGDGQQTFHAVWIAMRSGRNRLYFSRSVDGGQTWGDPVDLSGPGQTIFQHRIAQAGDRMVIVWQDMRMGRNRVFAVASSDKGATWSPPAQVDNLAPDAAADAYAPAVTMSPAGEVVVAWQDNRHGRDDVFVGRSLDGGRTWDRESVRLDMDEPGTAFSRAPAIARSSDGRIAVAWEDDRAGYERLYMRVRDKGERGSWGPEIIVWGPEKGMTKMAAKVPGLLWAKSGQLYMTWEAWDVTLGTEGVLKRVDTRTVNPDQK